MSGTTRTTRSVRHRAGLTLVELLLAVAITALIGGAISIVMTAAGQNLTRVSEVRSALQRAHATHARLRAYTDASFCILEEDSAQGVAVWLHDERTGGTINLSELRILWFNSKDEELVIEWITFPDDLTEQELAEADAEVTVGADYFAEMLTHRSRSMTSHLVLADGIASFDLSHEAVSFIDADRLCMRLMLRINDDEQQPMLFTIGIPNHTVPN